MGLRFPYLGNVFATGSSITCAEVRSALIERTGFSTRFVDLADHRCGSAGRRSPMSATRAMNPRPLRFVADRMRPPTRYLRFMGYDTLSASAFAEGNTREDTLLLSLAEGRTGSSSPRPGAGATGSAGRS